MASNLPGEGPARVGTVDLPYGRPLTPGADFQNGKRAIDPVLWASDDLAVSATALWRAILVTRGVTEPVPVLLDGLNSDSTRPWDRGEFSPGRSADADPYAVEDVLQEMWEGGVPGDEEELAEMDNFLAPFALAWPGMASEESAMLDRNVLDAALASQPPGRLGLVAASRPADIPVVVGWMGTVNDDTSPAELTTVLRSWEDRFGATLFRLGFDTMEFLVERPPPTEDRALAVAAEHFAFCSDKVSQEVGSIEALAQRLRGTPVWSFWWD